MLHNDSPSSYSIFWLDERVVDSHDVDFIVLDTIRTHQLDTSDMDLVSTNAFRKTCELVS